MEIILSILFLLAFWLYYRYTDKKASDHCNTYNIDWEKVNEDRIKNDLSGTQINKNIAKGEYDSGKIMTSTEIKASQKAEWEDFKKKHPNGSWN